MSAVAHQAVPAKRKSKIPRCCLRRDLVVTRGMTHALAVARDATKWMNHEVAAVRVAAILRSGADHLVARAEAKSKIPRCYLPPAPDVMRWMNHAGVVAHVVTNQTTHAVAVVAAARWMTRDLVAVHAVMNTKNRAWGRRRAAAMNGTTHAAAVVAVMNTTSRTVVRVLVVMMRMMRHGAHVAPACGKTMRRAIISASAW